MSDNGLVCPICGKEMIDDYMQIDTHRVKNGILYKYNTGSTFIMCHKCYKKIVWYSKTLNRPKTGSRNILGYDYKKQALKAARDLFYPDEAIEQIEHAKSSIEIEHIMSTYRSRKFGDKE